MRKLLIVLAFAAFTTCIPASAQVSVSIGINVPAYPDLRVIPGYPVYYAPNLQANYFFYDGYYWIYEPDGWYASPWYDGPWQRVSRDRVPLFVLRVPLRYYGHPPATFTRWIVDAPPRWDVVWGSGWARRHHDWQRWNRSAAPRPAPLPTYQQRYTRDRYPNDTERRALHQQHYGYAPRDRQVRQQWQADTRARAIPPSARPVQPQSSQAQPPRPVERHGKDMQRGERRHAQAREQAPPPGAPVLRPEPPREQVRERGPQQRGPATRPDPPRGQPDIQRPAPMPMPGAAEAHRQDRDARPDHRAPPGNPDKGERGGKPDKGDRGDKRDKDGDHDSGKRHH